jgi:hypothetical protein
MTNRPPQPLAVCSRCRPASVPLVPTFHFARNEFVCLECGATYGMFGCDSQPVTPALDAYYDALKAEWAEHAPSLITARAWHVDCAECAPHDEQHYHEDHATDAEWEAHRAAWAWFVERTNRKAATR